MKSRLLGLAVLAELLFAPAIRAEDKTAEQAQSAKQLKQIALAMHGYITDRNTFPAAYSTNPDGHPLLSWRVQMLPYLEEGELYRQFHLDEPWDSEHNKALIEKMPSIYAAPGSKAANKFKTVYLVPHSHGTDRHSMTMFADEKQTGFKDIGDGTSRTILLVEASDDRAVIWTKPDDYEVDFEHPNSGLIGLRDGGFLSVFADMSVHFLKDWVKSETLKALFTRDGGERIELSDFSGSPGS